jgi:hypothetical protein
VATLPHAAAPAPIRRSTPPSERSNLIPGGGGTSGSDTIRGVNALAGHAGVAGLNSNAFGIGVHGENTATGSVGQLGAGTTGVTGLINNGDGVYGGALGSGNGVLGESNGGGAGVYGHGYSGAAGVRADGDGPTSTALYVSNGSIRVGGAGVGTATPVFIIPPPPASVFGQPLCDTSATARQNHSITCSCSAWFAIDHPLLNGDPNAILFTQPVGEGVGGNVEIIYQTGQWWMHLPESHTVGFRDVPSTADVQAQCAQSWSRVQINVMVIKP